MLARAMTYKFAALGERVGGAKAGLVGDPADRAGSAGLMGRYCAEIRPLADSGRFLTGPDMGTSEADFAPLRERCAAPHGDECVAHYGRPARPPGQLFTVVDADVVVPGTRPGVISRRTAESLRPGVQVVAPAANVPYTAAGADVLRRRGIVALPDFVCNAGAVIGYRSARIRDAGTGPRGCRAIRVSAMASGWPGAAGRGTAARSRSPPRGRPAPGSHA